MIGNFEFIGQTIMGIFVVVYILEFAIARLYKKMQRPRRDIFMTLGGLAAQSLISGPIIGMIAGYLCIQLWPESSGGLSHISFWLAFPVLFVMVEFLHYWAHRMAHTWRWLWKLHRTHHSATDLHIGVMFRLNAFWPAVLPHPWLGAACVYLGLGLPYMAAIMLPFLSNIFTHMNFRCDLWLREKMPWSEPFWRILEHIITLPDTHHAHHGLGPDSHSRGNYAVTLFIFDVIFGTAKIPNTRQTKFGLPNSFKLHWAEELFWPMVKISKKPR